MWTEKIKRNSIFILFILIGIICWIKRDNRLPMEVVPDVDSQITFSSEQGPLEQTWLSEVKEISEISFISVTDNSFNVQMQLNVLDEKTKEVLASSVQNIDFEAGQEKRISFSFPSIKNCQGKQYIFQLLFVDGMPENEVMISAGTNYGGCTIGGIDQSKGAAFQITFVKNSLLYWLFISFFPFICFSLFFMTLWQKKWEECVGVSTALLIFVMFLFGLFGQLEKGIATIYVIAIGAFIAGVYTYNKKKMCYTDLFSSGLILYGIMVALILLNCNSARFARWDEFSHWGLAVKDMFYSNSFAKHIDSAVMLKYYPPVTTLFEYFFCYTNRLFSESVVYVGFQILSLNLLFAGLVVCKNRKIAVVFPTVIGLLLIPIIFYNDVYNCIYADSMLAFGVAYVLVCYFTSKMDRFNLLRIIGGLFILTLTKDTGVVLAGLLTLVMLADIIYYQYLKKELNRKKIAVVLLCTAWVCLLFFAWQYFLKIPIEYEVDILNDIGTASKKETMSVAGAVSASRITLAGIIDLFTGNAPEYRYTVIRNYFTRLFSENIYSFGMISLSYMDLAILLLVISILASGLYRKSENKSRMGTFGVLTFIAGMGYVGFILVAYLFAFSEREAIITHSYGRYLGSYICGICIAFVIILIKETNAWEDKQKKNYLLILTAFILCASPVQCFVIKNQDYELTDNQVRGYNEMNDILQTVAQKGEKVYFVCNNTDGYAELQFKNAVVPLLTDYPRANVFASEESYVKQMKLYEENNMDEKGTPYYISFEDWEKTLIDYEYVVLFHANDVFRESYGDLFEEPDTIGDGAVYKVHKENDGINLKIIGKTEIENFR